MTPQCHMLHIVELKIQSMSAPLKPITTRQRLSKRFKTQISKRPACSMCCEQSCLVNTACCVRDCIEILNISNPGRPQPKTREPHWRNTDADTCSSCGGMGHGPTLGTSRAAHIRSVHPTVVLWRDGSCWSSTGDTCGASSSALGRRLSRV